MNRKIKVIANSLLSFIVALLLVNCTSRPQSIVQNRTNSQTRNFLFLSLIVCAIAKINCLSWL